MTKLKIKLALLGHLPHSLDTVQIKKWKSVLFEINSTIDTYAITKNSDGSLWQFTDNNIESQLPENFDEEVLLAITNVPVEKNYFVRRLSNNRICLTYHEMTGILQTDNIPLENLILRTLYALSLVYASHNNTIPLTIESIKYLHHETKGCLFDMNGIKEDIIYSTNKPKLCSSCIENLIKAKVPINVIDKTQIELKHIRKSRYYRIRDFIKTHPITAIFISSIAAILLGVIGSLIASFVYDKIK